MKPFASRSRLVAPAVAPHWILARRMLVFAVLIALTSGLRHSLALQFSAIARPASAETRTTVPDKAAAYSEEHDAHLLDDSGFDLPVVEGTATTLEN